MISRDERICLDMREAEAYIDCVFIATVNKSLTPNESRSCID